jgi:hypothetical protein
MACDVEVFMTRNAAELCCSPAASEHHASTDVAKLFEKHAVEPAGATALFDAALDEIETTT